MQRNIACVGRHMDKMYTVDFKKVVEKKAFAAPVKDVSVLDVCHARLADDDRCAVKWMHKRILYRKYICFSALFWMMVLPVCQKQ